MATGKVLDAQEWGLDHPHEKADMGCVAQSCDPSETGDYRDTERRGEQRCENPWELPGLLVRVNNGK